MDNYVAVGRGMLEISYLWGRGFCHDGDDAVRLGKPEKSKGTMIKGISEELLYVISGNNRQVGRKDLPLYLPGKWITVVAAAKSHLTAGYEGMLRRTPGFPDDGQWITGI